MKTCLILNNLLVKELDIYVALKNGEKLYISEKLYEVVDKALHLNCGGDFCHYTIVEVEDNYECINSNYWRD